ncbi:hypothetical protein E4T56_gene11186 [Termitomyces sp. T112]|nr:hypothetical protein E4T56_gene11186 [Termitomyces sp. T112]
MAQPKPPRDPPTPDASQPLPLPPPPPQETPISLAIPTKCNEGPPNAQTLEDSISNFHGDYPFRQDPTEPDTGIPSRLHPG